MNEEPQIAPPEFQDDETVDPSRLAAVKHWTDRIQTAKKHWEMDFERMRSNMDFTAGIQWHDQNTINSKRYVADITLQVVNQKEAALYAKNPTVVAKRRPRMDFQIWDERNETLAQAQQVMAQAQMAAQQGVPVQLNPMVVGANALLQDYQNGMRVKEQMDRVGKTLEIMYKYFCDCMSPDFKEQMKSLVRRTVICNVGYVRQEFVREYERMTPTGTADSMYDTMQRAQMLMQEFQDGIFSEEDAKMEELRSCLMAIQQDGLSKSQMQVRNFEEKLMFLFPKSCAIIPDDKCTDFVGFINADFVAEEHIWKLSYVNSYFEKDIKAGGEVKEYQEHSQVTIGKDQGTLTQKKDPYLTVWEVYDKTSKSKFWICNGYKDYLQEPEAVQPLTRHFWPWFALVFNKVEVDESTKATAIGPSDVQQMKHPQQEWNRTREELREHRKASAPQMFYKQGSLTEEDKTRLKGAPTGAWVGIEALQDGQKIEDIIAAKPIAPINPLVYDTTPLMQDIQQTTGQSESNNGQRTSRKGETATAAAIAEQSRVSKSASNVDDLDNLLSRLAENGSELMFYECQIETVKRIAGVGAVWPVTPDARKQFAECIYLEVQAASSGRPNQQLEVANFERLAPLLMQMGGGNPQFAMMLVREGIKRLNESIDISEMVPIPLQNVSPQQPLQMDQQQVAGQPGQQPQQGMPQAPQPTAMQGIHPNAGPQQQAGILRQ